MARTKKKTDPYILIKLVDNEDLTIETDWDQNTTNVESFGFLLGAIRCGTIGDFVVDAIKSRGDEKKIETTSIIDESDKFIDNLKVDLGLKVGEVVNEEVEQEDFKKIVVWEYYDLESEEDEEYDEDDEDDDESFEPYKEKSMMEEYVILMNKNNTGPKNRYLKRENWIAYTNFPVQESQIREIANVLGVELVAQFSRYTFVIAIAKLYDFTDVKHKVNSVLKVY